MVFKAIKFVAEAHQGHYRKGTSIPYISHLMNVMKILIEIGCDKEIITAGILHDVIEDTSVTPEQVERVFGKRVATIVAGASEPEHIRNGQGGKRPGDFGNNIPSPILPEKRHSMNFLSTVQINLTISNQSSMILISKVSGYGSGLMPLNRNNSGIIVQSLQPLSREQRNLVNR